MSLIFRRGVSTLIPPKVASPTGIGAAKDAARMERIVNFYERIPHGPAPEPKVTGPLSWYKKKYFGQNASPAPLAHLIGVLIIFGYSQEYYFHLRKDPRCCRQLAYQHKSDSDAGHHKNNAH